MRPDDSALVVKAVTRRFGGLTAVADLSITVPTGRIHGLIGPNGAGKTTTIGLVSGFLRPDAGSISFGPHDLTRLSPSAIARLGVSRTFQHATPLNGLTVFENILVGLHTRYRAGLGAVLTRSHKARHEAGAMTDAAGELLELCGLEALAATDARNLTFGQLRYLDIARAVARKPNILLLDEPAAGLNDIERKRLADLICRFRTQGMGVLLVDHDVPFVFQLADRMTVMNFGSVIAAGHPETVRSDRLVREAYLGTGEEGEA